MVKLKTILDTRRAKPDGTFAIMFRITNQKQVNYISFGSSVKETEWDVNAGLLSKHHPNANSINLLLSKRYYEIQKAIVTLEESAIYSFEELKVYLAPKAVEVIKEISFRDFSHNVMDAMKKVKRNGNASVYLTAVNRLVDYSKNPNITFKAIDYTFLDAFINTLQQEGIKINTIGNYLRSIRALYNKAIKAKIVVYGLNSSKL